MVNYEFLQIDASDLFLTFNYELHIDRKSAVVLHVCFNALQLQKDLSLIINRASCIDLPVFDDRLKRRTGPKFNGINRLNIIVSVDQYRRLVSAGMKPFAIYDRMKRRIEDLHILKPDLIHPLHNELCTLPYIIPLIRISADRRDLQKVLELFSKLPDVTVNVT